MTIRAAFLGLAVLAALANVVLLILIMAALDRRGHKTNLLKARVSPWTYLAAYKEATRKESGKPGRFYGLWIITINLALALALAGLLVPRAW